MGQPVQAEKSGRGRDGSSQDEDTVAESYFYPKEYDPGERH